MKLIKLVDTQNKIKYTTLSGEVKEKPSQTFYIVIDLGEKRVFIPIKPAFEKSKNKDYANLETFAITKWKKSKDKQNDNNGDITTDISND